MATTPEELYSNDLDTFLNKNSLSQGTSITNMNSPSILSDGAVGFEKTTMNVLKVNQNMESGNFISGTSGWQIKGNGDVEFGSGFFRGDISGSTGTFSGTITGGSLNIPDTTTTNSFHVDSSGNIWSGRNIVDRANAPFKVDSQGNLTFRTTQPNAIVIDNGSNILINAGGNLSFSSVTRPLVPPVLTLLNVAGNLNDNPNLNYHYIVTFVNLDGETDAGNAATVNQQAGYQQLQITGIPISSSVSVTKRKIYRASKWYLDPPMLSDYKLLTTINDNTTVSYLDNIADADLTTIAPFGSSNSNSSFGKIKIDGFSVLFANNSNTYVGKKAGFDSISSWYNTGIGASALEGITSGEGNCALGWSSLFKVTSGYSNVGMGVNVLHELTTGNANVSTGCYSQNTLTTGSNNTSLGDHSLYYNSTGSSNVALGYYAGRYETGSNSFYLDNQDRTNTAGDKSKALLYGIFDASTSNQKLTINGLLNQSVSKTPATSSAAGVAGDICWDSNYIYICTATNTWKRSGITTW